MDLETTEISDGDVFRGAGGSTCTLNNKLRMTPPPPSFLTSLGQSLCTLLTATMKGF